MDDSDNDRRDDRRPFRPNDGPLGDVPYPGNGIQDDEAPPWPRPRDE